MDILEQCARDRAGFFLQHARWKRASVKRDGQEPHMPQEIDKLSALR